MCWKREEQRLGKTAAPGGGTGGESGGVFSTPSQKKDVGTTAAVVPHVSGREGDDKGESVPSSSGEDKHRYATPMQLNLLEKHGRWSV